MHLHMWNFTNEDKTNIFGQFNKSIKEVEDDVDILREWLKKQPHIPQIQDKNLMELFLIRCKFSIEKTKQKLDKYFTVKTIHKDIFEDMDPQRDVIRRTKEYTIVAPVEELTPSYERVVYCGLHGESYTKLFNHKDITDAILMFSELALREDYAVSTIFIIDLELLSMAIIMMLDLGVLVKSAEIYLQGFSGRISSIHFINTPTYLDIFLKFLYTVLPKKLQERVVIHKNVASLSDYIPKNCIPKELKGLGKSILEMHEKQWNVVNSQRDYILKRNRECSIESLRIGEQTVETDLFGANGTFKKINID